MTNLAEQAGQLDPQSLAAQSVGVLFGSPLFIAGKLPLSFGSGNGTHMRDHGKVTQIPHPGSSGQTPTGAMQFADDWPGLFVRGDDAAQLLCAIRELQERLADPPDLYIASALSRLVPYADIISRDVIVRSDRNGGSEADRFTS